VSSRIAVDDFLRDRCASWSATTGSRRCLIASWRLAQLRASGPAENPL